MRIASPWLLQTRPHPQIGAALRRHITLVILNRTQCPYPSVHQQPLRLATQHASARASHRGDNSQSSNKAHGKNSKDAGTRTTGRSRKTESPKLPTSGSEEINVIPRLSHQERQDPETWADLLEKYLPTGLQRQSEASINHSKVEHLEPRHTEILAILSTARKTSNAGTDILAYMMVGRRRKPALWLCDYLLKDIASRMPGRFSEELPSNISWPKDSFYSMTGRSIKVDTVSHVSNQPCDEWSSSTLDPRYSFSMSNESDRTMDQIWSTLGSVVIQAADMVGDEAQKALNAVQLVLGQVHNLDLVPDNVYAYHVPPFSSAVRKTPIIHLVSSRILTALSDATWRDQQQENIEKAASHGLSYAEIGRDPPGGRFRLKVRPMDAEVWLEFILWCCAEGGFAGAGARIVNQLQRNTQDPWFALTWTDSDGIGQITPRIDWARVKSRTGGTVGRLEGYSTVKPLAEMPPRTISTEVILALVESHVDSLRRVHGGRGMTVEAAQHVVVRLLSFLEPHDLPVFYFDYISTRLLQTEAFDVDSSRMTRKWSDRLALLKALKPAQQPAPPCISFQYDALLVHSEFTAGLLQQALDGFVQEGNIHDALKAFNDLQKLVDNSKLNAIGSFLQRMYADGGDFFGSQYFEGNPDFVNSHGQLPMYKLAGLLNLATDTDLVGFGQWLLYNEDPDGPLIPKASYGSSTMARALIRFAGLSNDHYLLESVSAQRFSRRLPTVNYLRTILNARLSLLDFAGAAKTLKQLDIAQGGGFGLSNLAHLAGTILKLEQNAIALDSNGRDSHLHRATNLLDLMLAGKHYGRKGVLQQSIRVTFKQQIAHLLTLFGAYPDSSLANLAETYRKQYRAGNLPTLQPTIFNTFLEAVISAKGAEEGVRLVDRFCAARFDFQSTSLMTQDGISKEDYGIDIDTDETSDEQSTNRSLLLSGGHESSIQSFIPFDEQYATDLVSEAPESKNAGGNPGVDVKNTNTGSHEPIESLDHELTSSSPFSSPFFESRETPQMPVTDETIAAENGSIDDNVTVCVYDARTVRLIVRRVNRDLQNAESSTQARRDASFRILRWARRKFTELGYDSNMINNEIREPMTDHIDPSPTARKVSVKTDRHAKKNRASRISRSFGGMPILSTKGHA